RRGGKKQVCLAAHRMAHSSRLTLSASAARAAAAVVDDDDLDEEPGEEIESAPPLRVGEEREIGGAGLRKKLLRPGRGWETPVLGDEVTVHYEGRLLDGRKSVSTRDRGEPLTFELGGGKIAVLLLFETPRVPPDADMQFETRSDRMFYSCTISNGFHHAGHLCPALPKIVKTMRRGEKAFVTIQPQYAFGEAGREATNGLPAIPSNAILNIELELVSLKPVVDVTGDMKVLKKILRAGKGVRTPNSGETVCDMREMTGLEKIQAAEGTKSSGNDLFKNGKFERAAKKYDKVLDNEFCNVKALYRRAQAYIEAADLDLAKLDIQKALEIDPNNKLVGTRIIQLEEIGNLSTSFFSTNLQGAAASHFFFLQKLKVEKPQGDEWEGSAEVEASNLENDMVMITKVKGDREMQAMETEMPVVDATCACDRVMTDSMGTTTVDLDYFCAYIRLREHDKLEDKAKDREARWEHIGRLPEEDRKIGLKNARGCRIGGILEIESPYKLLGAESPYGVLRTKAHISCSGLKARLEFVVSGCGSGSRLLHDAHRIIYGEPPEDEGWGREWIYKLALNTAKGKTPITTTETTPIALAERRSVDKTATAPSEKCPIEGCNEPSSKRKHMARKVGRAPPPKSRVWNLLTRGRANRREKSRQRKLPGGNAAPSS
ncbi:hypothetical protein B296_00024462, partial [Ensete ventricosum]